MSLYDFLVFHGHAEQRVHQPIEECVIVPYFLSVIHEDEIRDDDNLPPPRGGGGGQVISGLGYTEHVTPSWSSIYSRLNL